MLLGKALSAGVVLSGVLSLGACAGRAPNPVAVVQPQDRYMDCTAIQAESRANADKLTELGKEDGGKVAQNVAAGVAGVFIPVLWFAMDFQNASGKEAQALNARQQYLGTLAEQRCAPIGAPIGAGPVQATSPQPVSATADASKT
ncbi:MAG: hypothetical protein JSR91_11805 [Proteobacteria bacterium]|nr:hypothetical protein [Pseudomonadota bacterium]